MVKVNWLAAFILCVGYSQKGISFKLDAPRARAHVCPRREDARAFTHRAKSATLLARVGGLSMSWTTYCTIYFGAIALGLAVFWLLERRR